MPRQYGEFELQPHERVPVPIVADGALANPVATGGALVPAVVIDATDRSDIEELVRRHAALPEGEVVSSWGKLDPDDPTQLCLILQFSKPERVSAIVCFDVDERGGLVDSIMQHGRIFLFPGRPGDTPSQCMNVGRPFVLLEVTTIPEDWQQIWTDVICRKHNCSPEAAHRMQDEWRRVFGRGGP